MFSEEQERLRIEKEKRDKGSVIYRTVVPTNIDTKVEETEAAPSEEKGILEQAKDAIVSAVTEGIESVKEFIHDVSSSIEPEKK